MKTVIILSIFLICVIALVVADTTDILPPSPSGVRERAKIIPPESLSVSPDLQKVRERPKVILPESSLSVQSLPSVQERSKTVLPESGLSVQPLSPVQEKPKNIAEDKMLEVPSFQPVQSLEPTTPPFGPLQVPSFNEVVIPKIAELNDFSGGLNRVSFPTHVAKKEATKLINALWNPQGEMYKRPGYSEHSTPPFIPNFLYAYYKQTGEKYTMGGSDTALYFWHPDTSGDGWTYLTGTEGTSGRWDGTTFEDMFVGTHEGIVPVVWNGSTMVTMGTSIDSFQIEGSAEKNIGFAVCMDGSTRVDFDVKQTGWDANEWLDYTMGFWAYRYTSAGVMDTFYKYQIVMKNTADDAHINHINNYEGGILNDSYARFYSWFGIDSIWREGTIDSIITCAEICSCVVLIYDSTFYWDSTFAYDDYIFEITAGEGKGIKRWMNSYGYWVSDYSACGWDTLAFMLPGYTAGCFDIGSHYRIYAPAFIGKGAKFCESWEGALWLGWAGIGDEQNKNMVNWSGVDDLGKWNPDHHIIIESDDGDFITGMAKFPGEYTDVPRQEMIVTKNNSLYKIVPSGDDYAFWLIQSGVGGISNSAISPAEGLLLFPDQHGVWAYDQRKPFSISAKIKPIFETWDLENLEDVSAVYNPQDRHYYLSYPGLEDTLEVKEGFITSYYVTDAEKIGIYTAKFGSDGAKLRLELNNLPDEETYSDIATKENGDYVLTWHNPSGTDEDDNLFLQRFDSLDQAIGDSIKINDVDSTVDGFWSTVDMNNSGQIITCWEDHRSDTSDIYCQAIDFDNGKVGANFVVNDDYLKRYDALNPEVDINDNGFFVVTWTDSFLYVVAKKYNWSATPIGSFFHVSEQQQADYASVIVGQSNQFVVTWHSPTGGSNKDTWMRFYDSDGNPNTEALVNTEDAGRNCLYSDVAINNSGRFVIVWHKDSALLSDDQDIYARQYESDGSPVGLEFKVNTDTSGEDGADVYPAVALNNYHSFMIVWQDDKNALDDIYGQLYNWDGAVGSNFAVNDTPLTDHATSPKIDVFKMKTAEQTWGTKSLVWSFDYHGWSELKNFITTAYCYQHSLTDSVKILFADPAGGVYNYGTQSNDVSDPVFLTYQGPYFRFSPYPWQRALISYATIESYSDSGEVILSWYSDYGTLIVEDTLIVSGYDLQTIDQSGLIEGQNISLKITTSADLFKLAGYYLEYLIDKSRR